MDFSKARGMGFVAGEVCVVQRVRRRACCDRRPIGTSRALVVVRCSTSEKTDSTQAASPGKKDGGGDDEDAKSATARALSVAKAVLEAIGTYLRKGPVVYISGVVSGLLLTIALLFVPESNVVGEGLREKVRLFDIIMQDISRNYVEPVDEEKLFETGMRAMLSSLDPYTQFENNVQAKEMNLKTMGRYGGVGLGLAPDIREPNRIVVVSAFEGYAYDVGVRPGDYIEMVDTEDVRGRSIEIVTDMLRGPPGTSVKLTVARVGSEEQLSFKLDRRFINLRDVPVAAVLNEREGIVYIKLQSFAKDAASELRRAMARLSERAQLQGVILDLRGNPGGLLNSAVEVAEVLVPKGSTIVSTKGRDMVEIDNYSSTRQPALPESARLAVLVNGQTASAAEIVAGAVQDLDLGLVIGTRTFGKGLIQNIQSLPYQTALRYTIGRYFTPSGRCIQSLDYSTQAGVLTTTEKKDQERTEFKTLHGRTVKDGGGIEVDVTVPTGQPSELEAALLDQGFFFYFANDYAAKLDGPLPVHFDVNDRLYNDFVNYVDSSNFLYESRVDLGLASLQSVLKEEGYEKAGRGMDELRQTLSSEMRLDFVKHREQIRKRIEWAIRTRTQPDSTRLFAEALKDEQVLKASEILRNSNLYAQLLRPYELESQLADTS